MSEPEWLTFARRFLGRRELPGPESNDWLVKLWYKLKAGWVFVAGGGDDSTVAWCGLFVASCFNELGYPIPPKFYRARSWLDWGIPLAFPVVGCVVVFARTGGGHVGFVVGRDIDGHLLVLGGNQGNRVSIAPFDMNRVLGYRWPNTVVEIRPLPIVDSDGKVSANEQ